MRIKTYNCPLCNEQPTVLFYCGDKIDDDKEIAYGCLNCKISSKPIVIPSSLFMKNGAGVTAFATLISVLRWNKSCEAHFQ